LLGGKKTTHVGDEQQLVINDIIANNVADDVAIANEQQLVIETLSLTMSLPLS
jgi:hypothetical protein